MTNHARLSAHGRVRGGPVDQRRRQCPCSRCAKRHAGTIRKSETEDVLSATLARRKVNPAKWSFKCGELHLLVGRRIVKFPAKAGNTYWGLDMIRQQLETAIDEMEVAAKHKGQHDLEDAIRAVPA